MSYSHLSNDDDDDNVMLNSINKIPFHFIISGVKTRQHVQKTVLLVLLILRNPPPPPTPAKNELCMSHLCDWKCLTAASEIINSLCLLK